MIKVAFAHTGAKNGGYGILGKGIRTALDETGLFEVVRYTTTGGGIIDDIISNEKPDLLLSYGTPDSFNWIKKEYARKRIPHVHYVVWESSIFPSEWVEWYKSATLLLTSSKHTQGALRRAGLNAKIWHHAIDARFSYKERKDDGVFTFYHYNGYEFRKGTEILLQAFTEEFGIDERVKLVIKARERGLGALLVPPIRAVTQEMRRLKKETGLSYEDQVRLEHPLITEVIGHVSDEEMVNLSGSADCFVFPAKGEGWGLPPFEAMAQGIVPIIPNVGSFAEWFDRDTMIVAEISGYFNGGFRYPGALFMVDKDDLRKKMRWAFNNERLLRKMGKEGSARIHEKYNWSTIMSEFYKEISSIISK